MQVVTYYFSVIILLPYYFFAQISCCTGVFYRFFTGFAAYFFTGLAPDFRKKSKKYANFLQFFLVVYQQVTRNLKK